jgi:hypothetical protein
VDSDPDMTAFEDIAAAAVAAVAIIRHLKPKGHK